jgi:hypothetical protein
MSLEQIFLLSYSFLATAAVIVIVLLKIEI